MAGIPAGDVALRWGLQAEVAGQDEIGVVGVGLDGRVRRHLGEEALHDGGPGSRSPHRAEQGRWWPSVCLNAPLPRRKHHFPALQNIWRPDQASFFYGPSAGSRQPTKPSAGHPKGGGTKKNWAV